MMSTLSIIITSEIRWIEEKEIFFQFDIFGLLQKWERV
jgi:hypothetical protein